MKKAILATVLGISALAMLPNSAFALSGTVFRDVGRDGVQTTVVDVGINAVTVNAFNAASATVPCASGSTNAAGVFNFVSTACGVGAAVRVEVVGFSGISANSSTASNVQFVLESAAGVNIPVTGQADFCAVYTDGNETNLNANPPVTSNQLISGTNTGGRSTTRTAFRINYNDTGAPAGQTLATHAQTGATWGIAHQRTRDRAFYSAFQRRRGAFGPGTGGQDGTGAIYIIDAVSTCTTCTVSTVDLDTLTGSATTTGVSTHTTGSENFAAVGTAATNIAVDAGAYTNTTAVDPANPFSQVGKIGLGDIDISSDGRTLYAINLADRSLYALNVTGAGLPTIIDLNGAAAGFGAQIPAPTPACANGVARPFAIGIRDGTVHVGGVCTGENAGTAADVDAFVFAFNTTTNTYTQEVKFDLNYTRGCADVPAGTLYTNGQNCPTGSAPNGLALTTLNLTGGRARWNPWTDKIPVPPHTGGAGTGWPNGYRVSSTVVHAQPMLSDIEFLSPSGDMVVAFRDRWVDQISNNDFGPEAGARRNADGVANGGTPVFTAGQYDAFAGGEVLRLGLNTSGAWVLENNAAGPAGSFAASFAGANTGDGPGTCTNLTAGCGEFFYGDNTLRSTNPVAAVRPPGDPSGFQNHDETSFGGLAVLPTATAAALGADANLVPARAAEPADALSTELLLTAEDPINTSSGGVIWLRSNGTRAGGRSDEAQSYASSTTNGTAQKSNGMGDIEILCNASPLTLGNRVFNDTNGNGVQDPGEAGIDGVTLSLRNAAGTLVGQATTVGGGLWSFTLANRISATADVTTDNVVRTNQPFNQNYFVTLDAANFTGAGVLTAIPNLTNPNIGAGASGSAPDARDSDGTSVDVDPTAAFNIQRGVQIAVGGPGQNDQSIDFGVTAAAKLSIGNRVFFDTNNNGVQAGTELGIAGVVVELLDETNVAIDSDPVTAGIQAASISTDTSGYYRFDNLAARTGANGYRVRIAASNFTGAGVLVGYNSSTGATAAADLTDNGIDIASPATTGVSSATVVLANPTTVTGETIDNLATNGGNGTNGDGTDNLRVDFGFYRSIISNRVYFDTDNSGTRNGTEGNTGTTPAALQTLRVELRNSADVVIAVAFTDTNGNYSFNGATDNSGVATGAGIPSSDGVGAISYRVVIPTLPAPGVGDTLAPSSTVVAVGAGGAATDNNTGTLNGATARTALFTLSSGATTALQTADNTLASTTQPSADFGFIRLDAGDLPDTTAGLAASDYDTSVANNGPRHIVVTGLFLGTGVDGDTDGAPNTAATGDDTLDSTDDETGLVSTTYSNPASPCVGTTTVRFTATAPVGVNNARLNLFVDRNGDGDFGDPSEVGTTTFSGTGATQNVDVVLPARTLPQCTAAALATGGIVAIRARLALAADMTAASTATAAADQAGLRNSGEVEDYSTATAGTVPVTLSNVDVREFGSDLVVNFRTATEAGTLGYRVLADIGKGVQARVEIGSVASKTIDSLKEQSYSVRARNPGADQVWIEESSVDGKSQLYGPYKVGSSVGEVGLAAPLNWALVNAEQANFRAARELALRSLSEKSAEIRVASDGWVRITHEQLVAAGVDLSGQQANNIAVRLGSETLSARVNLAAKTFGPGSTIEFFAKAVKNSLYTTTSVYRIETGRSLGMPELDARTTGLSVGPVVQGVADTLLLNSNTTYSFSSPLEDPWFSFRALRSGGASVGVGSINFTLKDRVAPVGDAANKPSVSNPSASTVAAETLEVSFWGGLDYAGSTPDHNAVFKLNGTVLGQVQFDGFAARVARFAVPAGILLNGSNTFTVELPNSTGYAADIVNVESVAVGYTRTLSPQADRFSVLLPATPALAQSSQSGAGRGAAEPINASTFVVTGLSGAPVVAVLERGGTQSVLKTDAISAGSLHIELAAQAGDRLSLMPIENGVLPTAAIALTDPIAGAQARYLIISHPSFIANLTPLILAKQQQGFSVKVVDVEAIYRYYSAGVVDPAAIQLAIRRAQQSLSTTHVLLVGGDTYDYQNVLGVNSVSFIPTNYRRTSPIIGFTPSDAVYADTDGNGVPNVAIGRWPVRTNAELNALLGKTLSYQNTHKALFISDRSLNGVSYANQAAPLANLLGQNWTTSQLTLDSYASGQAATARADIISNLESGTSLLSYYGHSAPASWSREGLITANQVSGGLFNTVNQPFATVQLGCWGTYFVEPTSTTVAHQMLLMPKGAAAVLGATSLTESSSDLALGFQLLPRLSTTTLGEALVQAQQAVATELPEAKDVILGGTLLGDPALR